MKSSVVFLGRAACRILAAGNPGNASQIRTIVHKSVLRLPPDYPDPWPYKERGYNYIDALGDRTQARFHQNSKLIVVEGNIGVGKSKLSKELADQLGFYYMPEFKMEDILIDRYGNDLRDFYHLFPESFRMPDLKMFYKNPLSDMSAKMQQRIFECRFDQYLNAVAHILNTVMLSQKLLEFSSCKVTSLAVASNNTVLRASHAVLSSVPDVPTK
ncbi:unnamed protein product [Cylicostephanus goldi]|uniref:Deoxynucleoside kinase domain-containing protein n=1 Tax=Cylicostephanus goldi TaxID=71465 RepID=A0A3P6R5P1_CYLGO|nr:unnamed protein product [Cylicostephanus goldi]